MSIKRLIIFVLLITFILPAAAESSRLTFSTIELPSLRQAQLIGAADPTKQITFTVWPKLRNKAQLDQFVNMLFNPKSSQYQKFLTHDQFDAKYAPSRQTMQTIQDYFASRGMHAERVYSNVRITATAKQIEQAFQIKINNYRFQNRIYYGNASAPTLPSDIAQYVSGVTGLSNIPYAHPKIHQLPMNKVEQRSGWKSQILNFVWHTFTPSVTPTTTSFQGFTGANLQKTYNLANISPINGTVIDGTGQTIVIIDGCGSLLPAAIMNYANHYNQVNNISLLTTNNFAVVKPDGTPYTGVCPSPSGWDGEIILDVDATHTIAPGANIVLVLTDDVNNADVGHALNHITNNNFTIAGFSNAYVASNSWDNDHDNLNEPLDITLESVTAQGMSLNFAAGDCGDQTYNSGWTCTKYSSEPSIQYPVSSTYVTAVSGTSIFVDNNWNYAFETGWGTLVNGTFYSGSMGGISKFRSSPSWQASISGFTAGGYPNGTVGQYNKRAIPDIAMLADLYTGLLNYSPGCNPCYEGGASLATPLFSGTLTLVNQARSLLSENRPNPIGLAAPYFYTNNSTFLYSNALHLITPPHQIISGANPVVGGPISAFVIHDSSFGQDITFNWDSSLTIIENQFWNDVVGVGSPNIPNFIQTMATM